MLRKKAAVFMLCMMIGLGLTGGVQRPVLAEVGYMDNVTPQMSKPSYWSDKMKKPDKVLADRKDIRALNKKILGDSDTCMNDLANWSETSFDGVKWGETLKKAARDDAAYLYDSGSWFDADGKAHKENKDAGITKEDAINAVYGEMIKNCEDKSAANEMPIEFGIVTTRTVMRNFPSDAPLWDDPSDPDFDNMFQTPLRVNEPVIIKGRSNDKKYYYVKSDCSSGWVEIESIAICKNKSEWLDAWDFDAQYTLVVYGDKITTETSNSAPEISKRVLPMGTCLKLASRAEWTPQINSRTAHNNHVVWMPVRKGDGSYEKKLALISEHCKVSEGFLPLTSANLSMVALEYLGNCYGWGGMLDSEDCSGYVRDVYKCFGLNLARNTTWQAKQPVKGYKLDVIPADADEEKKDAARQKKADIIQKLPVGSVLILSGHEMIYLGCDNGKLYVISSSSRIRPESADTVLKIRSTIINTLDVRRASGQTWLDALTTAQVPYLEKSAGDDFGVKTGDEEPEKTAEELAQEVAQAQRKLEETQQKLDETQKKLEEKGTKISELEDALAASQNSLEEAQNNDTDDAQLIETLKQEISDTEAKLANAQEEFTSLNDQIRELQEQIAALSGGSRETKAPSRVKIRSVKAKKKALKIKWRALKDVSGYEIEVARNKKFTKNKKTITVKDGSASSVTVKKLKARKKYYVRVRAYRENADAKLNGKWSKRKAKKTRK